MVGNRDVIFDRLVRIALVAAITYWSFQLLNPFLGVLAWGFILAVALYPVYEWLNKRIGNHPYVAASILTLLSLLTVVGILALLANNMYETISDITANVRKGERIIPSAPEVIKQWPMVGEKLDLLWSSASSNLGEFVTQYSSNIISTGKIALAKTANKGLDLILFIIAVIFSGYLMTQGQNVMLHARKLAKRVALDHGAGLIMIMRNTIQNVSRGVIGVSLLQTMLFGILLIIARTPGAGLLSFIALIFCIVQIGLFVLVLPVVIWLFFAKSFAFALTISTLLLLVTLVDNLLKPYVFSRGLSTPMVVIFLGVIGGLITHGLIGIFIGPVVLAIFYDLAHHWVEAQ